MNLYLVACLVLSAVLCRTEGCCAPDQWEGHIGEIGGVARKSIFHAPKLIGGVIDLSYDATNKKVASTTHMERGSVKFIADFPNHKAYVIHNTTCKYFNMTKPFKKMCTDNATSAGSITFGAGSATLTVNSWNFKVKDLQGTATTTQDGCVPVSEAYFGKMKRDYVVMNLGFFNITTGIKDPSVFTPPSSCEPARDDIDNLLDSLAVSQGMKHTVNRFNGEEPQSMNKYLRYAEKLRSENDVLKI